MEKQEKFQSRISIESNNWNFLPSNPLRQISYHLHNLQGLIDHGEIFLCLQLLVLYVGKEMVNVMCDILHE